LANALFNHLIGGREQRHRHVDAKRLGGFEVDVIDVRFGSKADMDVACPLYPESGHWLAPLECPSLAITDTRRNR
jgi:hypothetical protein